jgi:hypothetical protein
MRVLVLAAAAAVATTLASASSAFACGDDRDDVSPVVVQPVSLLEQAARMDVEATSFERSAATVRRQARMLDARAARMRNDAAGAPWRMRGQLLAQATDLEARAEQSRADAMAQEQRAATLRAEANAMRVRARGGRPGWRGAVTVNL